MLLATLAIAAMATGCADDGGAVHTGVDMATARQVLARHVDDIEDRYSGVIGTGVDAVVRPPTGTTGSGTRIYGIVVYLRRQDDRPDEPQSIEGVPLTFEVTGEFHTR
jgi:hypothetical protein